MILTDDYITETANSPYGTAVFHLHTRFEFDHARALRDRFELGHTLPTDELDAIETRGWAAGHYDDCPF